MIRIQDKAIVLHSFPFSERDRIVILMTEHHGKVTGIAKNGLHSKRFGGALDLMACSEVELVDKKTSDILRIDSAKILQSFDKIRLNYKSFCMASYMLDISKRAIGEKQPIRSLFVLLSNALFYLEKTNDNKILHTFHHRLITILGYKLKFSECSLCGEHVMTGIENEIVHANESRWNFDYVDGKIYCGNCIKLSKKSFQSHSANINSLRFMATLENTPFNALTEIAYQQNDFELFEMLERFLLFHIPGLEKELKSAKSLQSVL